MPPKRKTSRDTSPGRKKPEEKTVYIVSRTWLDTDIDEGFFDNMEAAKDCMQYFIRHNEDQWTQKHEACWYTHDMVVQIDQRPVCNSMSSWKAQSYPGHKD